MTRLGIHGIAVEFERRGSGPPVVLVHGLGGPPMWERVAPILAARHDVLLPHLPGFGESPPAETPLTVQDHARLLARMLEELAIRGAVLAGVSYGGEIAAEVAASNGALVKELVLICPTGTRRFPWYLRGRLLRPVVRPLLRAALPDSRISDALSRRSFHDLSARPSGLVERYLEQLRRPGRLTALVRAVDELREEGGRLPGILERAGVPVTFVWGENDRTIRPSSAAVLRAVRPDAGVYILPRCGHSAGLEQPQELARIIESAATRRA